MKQNSHIDKVFAQRLKGRKKAVPAPVWDSIEQTLDKKKKSLLPLWAKWGAAAAILFLVFQLGYQWSQYSSNDSSVLVKAKIEKKALKNNKINILEEKNIPTNKPKIENINSKESPKSNTNSKKESYKQESDINTNTTFKTQTRVEELANKLENTTPTNGFVKKTEDVLTPTDRGNKNTHIAFNSIANKRTEGIYIDEPFLIIKNRDLSIVSSFPTNPVEEEKLYSYTGEKKREKQLDVGVSAARSYTYRQLSANTPEGLGMSEYYNEQENGMNKYAAMAEMSYKVSSRFSVQLGLAYNTYGFQDTDALTYAMKGRTYHLSGVENSAASYAVTDEKAFRSLEKLSSISLNSKGDVDMKTAVLTQEFAFLQIPISVAYSLIKGRRFDTKILSGVSPGYMLKESSNFVYDGENIPLQSKEEFNRELISGLFGLAVQYQITKHINFKVQPMLNYAFSSVVDNTNYQVRPYSWNIFGGIHYRIL